MDIEKLLAANPAMTDIHLTEGLPLMIRVYGALKKMKEIAEPQLFAELISSYVPPDRQAAYQRTGSADSAFSLGNVRCRLHLYRSGDPYPAGAFFAWRGSRQDVAGEGIAAFARACPHHGFFGKRQEYDDGAHSFADQPEESLSCGDAGGSGGVRDPYGEGAHPSAGDRA